MTGWDAIVVGAGTAGSVLAARLSEDPSRRVLLLEAGPVARSLAATPAALLDARRVPGAEPAGAWNRWFDVELAPGRDWRVSRGRTSGGSSATNGAYFVHARPADLERWSRGTGPWAPAAVLPLRRAIERDLDLHGPLHGDRGPMPVSRSRLAHPAASAFLAAAADLGHPLDPDGNGDADHGVGPMPANAAHGVRWSAASAYLLGALARPNLTVRGGIAVRRVRCIGGRAVGVDTSAGAIESDLVVLAAGALISPELLLRSGVGPAAALQATGAAVVLDAPGVGAQLSDHPQVVVEWLPGAPLPRPSAGWAGGMLQLPVDGGEGDVEVLQSLVPMGRLTRTAEAAPLPLLVSVHEPTSPGRLALRPDGRIRIEQGYLRSAADRRRLRGAVRAAAEVVLAPAFATVSAGLVGLDRATLGDDGGLDDWIAARLGTALHTCATVPFRRPGRAGPRSRRPRRRGHLDPAERAAPRTGRDGGADRRARGRRPPEVRCDGHRTPASVTLRPRTSCRERSHR